MKGKEGGRKGAGRGEVHASSAHGLCLASTVPLQRLGAAIAQVVDTAAHLNDEFACDSVRAHPTIFGGDVDNMIASARAPAPRPRARATPPFGAPPLPSPPPPDAGPMGEGGGQLRTGACPPHQRTHPLRAAGVTFIRNSILVRKVPPGYTRHSRYRFRHAANLECAKRKRAAEAFEAAKNEYGEE